MKGTDCYIAFLQMCFSKMLNEKIFFINLPWLPGEIEVSIVLLISLLTYTVAMIADQTDLNSLVNTKLSDINTVPLLENNGEKKNKV